MGSRTIKNLWALVACGVASAAAAQSPPLPPIEENHGVVGWFANLPAGTFLPSRAGAYPQNAEADPPEFDTRLVLPQRLEVHGLTLLNSPANPQTLLYFSGLPDPADPPAPYYVSFPFKTGPQTGSDILLNQVTYSLDHAGMGTDFNVTTTLVDVDAGGAEYPLSKNVQFRQVYDPSYRGFQVVNNQQWPMLSPEVSNFPAADAYVLPVPLKPNHRYELRTYLAKDSASANGLGMMDDMSLYMQAVKVTAVDDPVVELDALTGGDTTVSVVANDFILGQPVDPSANHYTVTPVGPLPAGVTLRADGTFHVAPAQPQTYNILYQLCPNYGPNLFGSDFQSSACQQAMAEIRLVGVPPPPQVSVTCTPPAIADSDSAEAVCTIQADTVVTNPLPVRITPPGSSTRFESDCTSPVVIPAASDFFTCKIKALSNDLPGDGNAVATITLVPDPTYVIGNGTASVEVQDDDLSIVGSVQGAPATFPPELVGKTVNYNLNCAPQAAIPASGQLTIGSTGQLTAPATHVPPGVSCSSMTLDGIDLLPAAPQNYEWKSAAAVLGGTNAFTVTLTLSKQAAAGNVSPVPALGTVGLALLSLMAGGAGLVVTRRRTKR